MSSTIETVLKSRFVSLISWLFVSIDLMLLGPATVCEPQSPLKKRTSRIVQSRSIFVARAKLRT